MNVSFEDLTLEEKLGQRFIFGTNTSNIDMIIELIKNYHIGGVILYKKNYENYSDMISVIKRIKEANKNNKLPLFIAIDQEGGKVNRMPKEIHNLKNIYDVSKSNLLYTNDYAKILGQLLSSLGINMNFAPVLDIYNNSDSLALYKRCFYGNSDSVIKLGERYLKEMENYNVLSVIKHYPGHGASRFDSHRLLPVVKNYKKVLNIHMKPFDSLMNKSDGLMLGHIVVKKLTHSLPTSISDKFIKKYIREKNNYNGLVITDEINMLKRYPIYNLIYKRKALKSSSDIILVKINKLEQGINFIRKYKKIYDIDKLNQSVYRIIDIKKKYHISDDTKNIGIDIEKINNLIDNLNNNI